MVDHQGPRRRSLCKIEVNGTDVTARLNPYLISVQVVDTLEMGMDQCHIELDDRNAELEIPPDGVNLKAFLGWAGEGPRLPDDTVIGAKETIKMARDVQNKIPAGSYEAYAKDELPFGGPGMQLVFSGVVNACESGFSRRGGGRRLWITAEATNIKSPVKETQNQSYGEGKKDDSQTDPKAGAGGAPGAGMVPFSQVFMDLAQKVGVTAKLSPEFMKISRDYWHVGESFMQFGQRMADEMGGVFKIANGIATIVGKGKAINVDGTALPLVEAVWGINLIAWRIKPFVSRPQYSESSAKFFDSFEGAHNIIKASIGGKVPFGGANAIAQFVNAVPNANVGGQVNEGTNSLSQNRRGTGWVMINGDPRAAAGNNVKISGARPGVDGTYYISEAEHNYTRSTGFTTRMNVQNPQLDYSKFRGWRQKQEDQDRKEKLKKEEEAAMAEAAKIEADAEAQAAKEQDELVSGTPSGDNWTPPAANQPPANTSGRDDSESGAG